MGDGGVSRIEPRLLLLGFFICCFGPSLGISTTSRQANFHMRAASRTARRMGNLADAVICPRIG